MPTSLAALTLLSSLAFGPAPVHPIRLNDAEIAHVAVTANQLDIAAAEQALQRSHSPKVRGFAETMIRDHQAVINQATALAARLGVEPMDNEASRSLSEQADATRQKLASQKGASFDRAYMENEVAYHEAVIATVRDTLVPATSNADLRALLEGVLPALQAHLQQARDVLAGLPTS